MVVYFLIFFKNPIDKTNLINYVYNIETTTNGENTMPNWNHNLITLTAKTDVAKTQLHTFIDKHIIVLTQANYNDSLLELDNNSIIPIPEGIKKLQGMTEIVQTDGGNFVENKDYSKEAEAEQIKQNNAQYGYSDWYEFCCGVWGSKWGFCHTAFHNNYGETIATKDELHSNLEISGEIEFYTDCAWSPATGLMKKICELYPDIEFSCEWGEEQVTEYYGVFTYDKTNGWEKIYKSEMNVDEAYDMLNRLNLLNPDEDDGYFPNYNTGLVDYDERLDADSEEYLTEDQREGIVFGDVGNVNG